MEKIILFLIVIGVGSLFEYLKKLRKERADSSRAARPQSRRPVIFNGFTQFMNQAVSYTSSATDSFTVLSSETPQVNATAETRCQQSKEKPGKSERKAFLPGETHESISVTEPLEIETLGEITAPSTTRTEQQDEASAEAHYRRWRQAIIDSEILRPKFTDSLR